MDFRGKHVLITGASTGIGRELAIALGKRGARLTVAARGQKALDETVAQIPQALAVPTDVADPESCRRLVDAAVARFGPLDALVNNAGISMWDALVNNAGISMWARFEEVTDLGIFDQLMRVNYLGAVYCTHFALPHLKKTGGLLVAVSSLTGKTGVPTRTGYAASKHAMQGFFDSLRIELAGTGVDVLVVSPGFVATDVRAHAFGGDGRPLGESPRHEDDKGTMPLEECVRQMVAAMEKRQRELVMTAQARFGLFVKLVAPSLVDRMAANAVKRRDT
jgi:NAD(P)-dependent dehydrogenase (short-subunit alcohol dehydrogenase family)